MRVQVGMQGAMPSGAASLMLNLPPRAGRPSPLDVVR